MRENNIDISVDYTAMITAVGDMFKGITSIHELEHIDIPRVRALIQGRLKNLKESRDLAKFNGAPSLLGDEILDRI